MNKAVKITYILILMFNYCSLAAQDNNSDSTKNNGWTDKLEGLSFSAGYTGSLLDLNVIGNIFDVETHGRQLGYFDLFYLNSITKIGNGLKLFDEPHINIRTDFGATTSDELISIAEKSVVRPSGNLKLLGNVNIIRPFYFRYYREIFVSEISVNEYSGYSSFTFIPFDGDNRIIPVESQLIMTSVYQTEEIGFFITKLPEFIDNYLELNSLMEITDSRLKLGIYRAKWQRPMPYYPEDMHGVQLLEVYSIQPDFWGCKLGYETSMEYSADERFLGLPAKEVRLSIDYRFGSGNVLLNGGETGQFVSGSGTKYRVKHNDFELCCEWSYFSIFGASILLNIEYLYRGLTLVETMMDSGPGISLSSDNIFCIGAILIYEL